MILLPSIKKGLLLKSFFVAALCASPLSAKTLIFQSNESSSAAQQPASDRTSSPTTSNVRQVVSASVSAGGGNSELFFMVEQLKQEVMQLRGLVEEKEYQMRQMQERSKDRYREIDQRLQAVSKELAEIKDAKATVSNLSAAAVGSVQVPVPVASGVSSEVVAVQPSSVATDQSSDEQKVAYQNAYAFVRDKNFPEAIDALHAYVEKYPEGDLTGNAFYWLGEVYLVLPKLEQAKQAFTIVVKTFPGHRKLADAMYKLGVTLDRLQQPAEAEVYLKLVQEQFPGSTAAKLAQNYTVSR